MTGMEMYENMDLKTNLDLTLDHKKPYNNGLNLQNSTWQMTGTHQEVRLTKDDRDGIGYNINKQS